jgi:hypothetical protein
MKLLVESNKTLIKQNCLLAKQFTALSALVNTTPLAPALTPSTITPRTARTPAQLLAKRLTKYWMEKYCHMHGYLISTTHTSASCNKPDPNHSKHATRADTKGGVDYNKVWELLGA